MKSWKKLVFSFLALLGLLAPSQAQVNPNLIPSFPTGTVLIAAYPTGVSGVPPVVSLSGRNTQGDNAGGLFWYNASDTTSSASSTIIVDNAGRRWYALSTSNVISTGLVTPQQYGAFCDGSSHLVTAQDVVNNSSRWVGTYSAGQEWDFVGNQEAIYAAYATAPYATFSGTGSGTNLTVASVTGTIHVGDYISGSGAGTNNRIVSQTSGTPGGAGVYVTASATAASSASMRTIVWNNYGGAYTNLNKTLFVPIGTCLINAQLNLNAQNFEIDFAARGASLWKWTGDARTSMFYNNAISYGVINNISMSTSVLYNGSVDPFASTATPLWVMDKTSDVYSELATQQLTINNAYIAMTVNWGGISISPSGGSAQGDTILFNNLGIFGFASTYGVRIGGQNALSIIFLGGDIQGVSAGDAIANYGGTHFVYGMNFENQATYTQVAITPSVSQILNAGADSHQYSGCGLSCIISMQDVRSESDILALSPVNNHVVKNSGLDSSGSFNTWFPTYCYSPGMTFHAGNKGHIFMVVDDGGNGTWKPMNTMAVAGPTITDPTASYTINQWQTDYCLFFRFGSNGFSQHSTVVSNTATTVTTDIDVGPANSTSLYHIGGTAGTVEATWDSATPSYSTGVNVGVGQGFTLTANSTTIAVGSQILSTIMVNDYVVIPLASNLGPASGGPIYNTALMAKVTAVGASDITVNVAPKYSCTDCYGYWGTPITDSGGRVQYLDLTYPAVAHPSEMSNTYIDGGVVEVPYDVSTLTAGRADWLYYAQQSSPAASGTNNLTSSKNHDMVANLNSASTIDLTNYANAINVVALVPTTDATINAPVPAPSNASQTLELQITTNVTTPFTLTFGTNFISNGTFYTGTTSGKLYIIQFRSIGGKWVEVYRSSSPSQPCATSPTFGGSISDPTVTYSQQLCNWVRVGNIVNVAGLVTASSISGGGGNTRIVNGLPFAPAGASSAGIACSLATVNNFTLAAGYTQAFARGSTGQTYVEIGGLNPTTGAYTTQAITQASNGFSVQYSCSYQVASP